MKSLILMCRRTLKKKRHWKDVQYNIAVVLAPNGKVLKVFGRAMGERSDGSCFWAQVDFPWIWSDLTWNWTQVARQRLDTFLDANCKCKAVEVDSAICEWHRNKITEWVQADVQFTNNYQKPNLKDRASLNPGPIDLTYICHSDYPWIRADRETHVVTCTICHSVMPQLEYRNIFIRKHSFCGFPSPDTPSPVPVAEVEKPVLPPVRYSDEVGYS